jgi:hypothetical protein
MSYPAARSWLQNDFVRGAVSGIGVITALAGLAEIASLLAGRRPAEGGDHASI